MTGIELYHLGGLQMADIPNEIPSRQGLGVNGGTLPIGQLPHDCGFACHTFRCQLPGTLRIGAKEQHVQPFQVAILTLGPFEVIQCLA